MNAYVKPTSGDNTERDDATVACQRCNGECFVDVLPGLMSTTCPRCQGGGIEPVAERCKGCGGVLPPGDEARMSGLCQRCLNCRCTGLYSASGEDIDVHPLCPKHGFNADYGNNPPDPAEAAF